MYKKLLTILALTCCTAAQVSAQNTTIPFFGNDHLKEKYPNTDNRYLLNSVKKSDRWKPEEDGAPKEKRDFSNSYFFFKRNALDTQNVNRLNKFLYNQNQYDVFQSTSIQNFTANRRTVINAEVFSAFFGPVRFGLGGSFQTTKDTTQDKAIRSSLEKIRNQGGTLNINGLFPMMYLRNKTDAYHMGLFAQQQFGLMPNKIDTNGTTSYTGENTSLAIQSGILLHMDAGSSNEKNVIVRLYADVSYYYIYGNYYEVLKMADFGILGLKVGCVVGDLLNFSASGPLYSTSIAQRAAPFTIGVQFSPSQVSTVAHGEKENNHAITKASNLDKTDKTKPEFDKPEVTKPDDE